MTLSIASVEWAIKFAEEHSDGDVLPRLCEMTAIAAMKAELAGIIAGKPLSNFEPGSHRRFIVPKDELSYRQATQLDLQDTIILNAVAYEFGQGIESRRRAKAQVFSYRFSPSDDFGLYEKQSGWNDFWATAAFKSKGHRFSAYSRETKRSIISVRCRPSFGTVIFTLDER